MPLMFKRAEADVMIKIARLGPSVTTEDLFANLDFVTADIDREISRLCERARELEMCIRDSLKKSFRGGYTFPLWNRKMRVG